MGPVLCRPERRAAGAGAEFLLGNMSLEVFAYVGRCLAYELLMNCDSKSWASWVNPSLFSMPDKYLGIMIVSMLPSLAKILRHISWAFSVLFLLLFLFFLVFFSSSSSFFFVPSFPLSLLKPRVTYTYQEIACSVVQHWPFISWSCCNKWLSWALKNCQEVTGCLAGMSE